MASTTQGLLYCFDPGSASLQSWSRRDCNWIVRLRLTRFFCEPPGEWPWWSCSHLSCNQDIQWGVSMADQLFRKSVIPWLTEVAGTWWTAQSCLMHAPYGGDSYRLNAVALSWSSTFNRNVVYLRHYDFKLQTYNFPNVRWGYCSVQLLVNK